MTRTSRTHGLDLSARTRFRAVLGVLLAAGGLVACTAEEPPPPTNSAPVIVPGRPGEEASTIPPGEATPVEEEAPNDADVTFVQDMILHHAQALEMTALVPDRAGRDDVKGIADRIADTQQPEIDMMNRWLERYDKPVVVPDEHGGHGGATEHSDMPGMASEEQLQVLRDTGGESFETLFLQLMVAHHQGALTMVEGIRKAGVNVRVQEIADDVAVTQTDEIHRMQGMLAA
ncbi:MAG: DUF305 domain-containing protein [Actinophytocola sp.]|uniref:DUF305 domain-containing protein n=1 Tax=Actinophytocola sp. TaxID=1872138 RepID=UPI001326E54C|nr:DUF305 domain-containing protein [Actinophytocola sp.]MPZ80046.1 DUF305 domain-containing protein [Actinophytocola sp.]